ncbi:hypothetical protein CE91St36_03060 [Christensenellaceae bacterium]|nr:hypothetical protein CE91St36_03060 [Christensenellaceae bacterium]BDF60157.1 hypothetical protein CE91St37_03070 [Christensenellaceae bacterium]
MENIIPLIQKPEILRFKNFASPEVAMKIVFAFEGYAKYCEQVGEAEDAGYYRKFAQGIMEHGTDPYVKEICDYVSDIFWSVDGQPSQYLSEEDIKFLQAVCEYREGRT